MSIAVPAFQVGASVKVFELPQGPGGPERLLGSGILLAPMEEKPDNTCWYPLDTGTVVAGSPHVVEVNGSKLLVRPTRMASRTPST